MITRGTTPTLIFSFDIDLSDVDKINVAFKQKEKMVLEKTEKDCVIDKENQTISITLSQEDTLSFSEENKTSIQIRLLFVDGSADATDIMEEKIGKILKEGILS